MHLLISLALALQKPKNIYINTFEPDNDEKGKKNVA